MKPIPLEKKSLALRPLSSIATSFTLAAAMALGAFAPTPANADEPPNHLGDAKGCAVVVGGMGGVFADSRVTMVWHVANTEITEYLHARMKLEQLRVVPLIVSLDQMRAPDPLVTDAMARHRCARVIRVVHEVNEDANGPYFKFKVSQLRLRSDTPVGEFEREYRYTRDAKTIENFRMSDLARQIYRDLDASGALGVLRS